MGLRPAAPGDAAGRHPPLSSQRQVQRHWRILRLESEMHIEGLGHIVLRIHNQGVCCDLLSSLQAAIDGAAQQKLAQTLASLIRSTRKPAHAKAGHWVSRQLLTLGFGKTLPVDLCRAERVVAKD